VPLAIDPEVLVVASERRLVVGEDPPVPRRGHDLGVERVAEALQDRPLLGVGSLRDRVAGFGDQRPPRGRRGRLHDGGVVVTEQAEEVALVAARVLDGVR
jgi:hypothetical protein